MKNGQNELAYYNSDDIRENNNHADFNQICWKCSLNAKRELDKVQKTAFARGKIIIQGMEIWIQKDIVKSWLTMADLEVGTEEYNNAQLIINKYSGQNEFELNYNPESPESRLKFIEHLSSIAIRSEKQLIQANSLIKQLTPKAKQYDKIVSNEDNLYGLEEVYKSLAINYFRKIREFSLYIHDVLKWSIERPGFNGKVHRSATDSAINQGYVKYTGGKPDPKGVVRNQFFITQKGYYFLKNHLSQNFSLKQIGVN